MANDNEITISDKKLEVLVAKFIPTSQYFERSFEMLQKQIDVLTRGQERIQFDMDKRFEQVDKRFEQVDKRFEEMISSINRLSDKLDNRDQDHRSFTMRMFSISIMISFLGVLGVFLKMFNVV